jgi:DNA replication protein DnaC
VASRRSGICPSSTRYPPTPRSSSRRTPPLGGVDLLCLDELGYMELDRRGAELLFQVLTEREEKASVAIGSNESFGRFQQSSQRSVLMCLFQERSEEGVMS